MIREAGGFRLRYPPLLAEIVSAFGHLCKDAGDKLPADLRADIEAKIATLRDAIAKNNDAALKTAHDALQADIQKIGEAVYASAGGGSSSGSSGPAPEPEGGNAPPEGRAGGSSGSDGSGGDDVVDAEFKEV